MARWPKFDDPYLDENLLLRRPSTEEQLEADWRLLRGEKDPIPPGEIPRLTKDQLKKFVLDKLAGQIFTSDDIECHPEHGPRVDLGLVFLPAAMGSFSKWSDAERSKVGVLWAYMKDAFPRGVNGYPMFHTMGFLHLDDWLKARSIIVREAKRLHEIDFDNP